MSDNDTRRARRAAAPIILLLLLLLLLLLANAGAARAQGFLRVDGQRLVDGEGREVLLRGIGLGGWMLQEGYMLRTAGPQHRIEARIEALVGPERTAAFYEAWLANHTRRIDLDSLAAWGFNSVRLPMHYKWFTPAIEEEPVAGEVAWRETGFRMVDELLAWAGANRMYLILDLHAAPGGQGKNADINDYDPEKPSLWESAANQEKTIALWRELAERYRDEPWLGGYDLINEPNWGFENLGEDPNGCAERGNGPVWELQERITRAIREVDRNHVVVIEGNCWGNNYYGLPALWDDNLVVSFHKYWNYNDEASIRPLLEMRAERNVPVWLGESGENSNHWFTNAIELLEGHGIGWAWWPLKKIGVNNPLEVVAPPGYDRVRAYWAGEGPRPTADEAFQALMELAENLKLERNVLHRDVVDAMIRQPHTTEVVPFRAHPITARGDHRVLAVDYDLGRQGYAYSDVDTANYRVSTGGPWTPWNHGQEYRNDGVDIGADPAGGYYVGWTEPGEWLQYTVDVVDAGAYALTLETAAAEEGGVVSLWVNDVPVAGPVRLPETGGWHDWTATTVEGVRLTAGRHRLRVVVERGGFNLKSLRFTTQRSSQVQRAATSSPQACGAHALSPGWYGTHGSYRPGASM
ncbi:MAG TPA: cellulase family glycosylhydrolase [Longimicrobiales bacterium]|nr:cellulase family glycosylhydrolase [Longimicrobiales bacterium]